MVTFNRRTGLHQAVVGRKVLHSQTVVRQLMRRCFMKAEACGKLPGRPSCQAYLNIHSAATSGFNWRAWVTADSPESLHPPHLAPVEHRSAFGWMPIAHQDHGRLPLNTLIKSTPCCVERASYFKNYLISGSGQHGPPTSSAQFN